MARVLNIHYFTITLPYVFLCEIHGGIQFQIDPNNIRGVMVK